MGAQPEGRRLGPGRPRLSRPGRPSGRPGRVTVTVTVTRRPGGPGTSPPPYHPGLPRKGRIYTRPPARCEDSRAIEPNRILEAGEFIGLPERPEMRDTLLFSIKKTHVAPRSSYSRILTFLRIKSRPACAEAALRAAAVARSKVWESLKRNKRELE